MTERVSFEFQVAWADLDSNRHLRNTAYLDYAAQTRFLYFASQGIGAKEFDRLGIGPAVLNDQVTYRRELHFMEQFHVELLCGGHNPSNSKFIVVNRFFGTDGKMRAEVRSLFVWFDLRTRKAVTAPESLRLSLTALPQTDDYENLD